MTPKFGGGPQKPSMPKKEAPSADAEKGGLKRKDSGQPAAKLSMGFKNDKDKPVFGDVAEENLDGALAEVSQQLEANPACRELHERKFKVLRKMKDRPAMRSALQAAARATGDPYFGVKLADALEEEGSFSKALEWRTWVAQFEPNDPDTIRRLAATAVRAGILQVAEGSYGHLIDLRKQDESPLGGTFYEEMLGRGMQPAERTLLQQMGLRLVTKALQHQPHSATLLEAGARLAYRIRDMESACDFYERTIAQSSGHRNQHQWKLELLRAYANAGKVETWQQLSQSFIGELQLYVQEFRGDSRAWSTLAQLQIQSGHFEEAISTLKSALASDSKNAQALWELGRLYVRMGRSREAVAYYEEIVNDPSEKKSVRRAIERTLADLHFKTGNYNEALELYQREPESNMRMIAPIYEALGDLATAEDLYLRSVKQAPRDARTHLGIAEYWVRRENWTRAAASGKDGLKCTYATEEVHSNLAVALATALMKLSRVEEALQTMEEICQAYPDSVHQLFRKVKLLKMLQRNDEAMRSAKEVRRSAEYQTGCAPASSSLWSLLGDCNIWLGNLQGAKVSYTHALRYDFMDSAAVRGLGMVADKEHDHFKAYEMYQRFVVLDPLNLATPAIKNMIRELREKLTPEQLAELEPPPAPEPEAQLPTFGGPPAAAAPPPRSQPQQTPPVQPGAGQGWLGGSGGVDWYE